MSSQAPQKLSSGELPGSLARVEGAPAHMFLTGRLPPRPWVAVVGTRSPTREGWRFAFTLARELGRAGVSVVSGGALGIDRAAHLGALRARSPTLVVAPSGWYRPFPLKNLRLFQRIVARGGGHLSAFAPEAPAARWTFLRRNSFMVALSDAAVVVEAPLRSGARNAASAARKLGTKLFAVPSAPWLPKGRGCLAELRLGAAPLESARDVLGYLEATGLLGAAGAAQLSLLPAPRVAPGSGVQVRREGPGGPEPVGVEDPTEPGSNAARVVSALRQGARHVAEVCAFTGLDVPLVQNEIFSLRLQGLVHVDPAGTLVLAPP